MCCISNGVIRNGPSSKTSPAAAVRKSKASAITLRPFSETSDAAMSVKPARGPEREAGLAEAPVVPRVERRDDVDVVVGVTVRDQHRAHVVDADHLLQAGERPGAGVHLQVIAVLA